MLPSFVQLPPCRPTTRRPRSTRPTAQSPCCWSLPRAEEHLWGRLPRQSEEKKVLSRPEGASIEEEKSTIEELLFIDTRPWRHVAKEFSTLLSHFQSFICLLVLILCTWGGGAFEDEITEVTAAVASSRISFLYASFHVLGCPPRPPAASGRPGNCFFPAWLAIYEGRAVFCLSAKLLGKDYRFASPDATVGFWQPPSLWSRQPSPKPVWSRELPVKSVPSVAATSFHLQIAAGCVMTGNQR